MKRWRIDTGRRMFYFARHKSAVSYARSLRSHGCHGYLKRVQSNGLFYKPVAKF